MNVRLSKQIEFHTNAWWDERLISNRYTVGITLLTHTADSDEHNVSMARIETFLKTILGNSVFININQKEQIEKLNSAEIRTVELPEDPFDQTVAIMLFCKLNAILDGKMTVTAVDVDSDAGGNVNYMFDEDDPYGPFADDGWWGDEEPTIKNQKKKSKVVKMGEQLSWADFGLQWELVDDSNKPKGNVITGDFNKKK